MRTGNGRRNSVGPAAPSSSLADQALAGLVDLADVAELLRTSPGQLRLLLRGRPSERRYLRFTLAKRRGGKRTIWAPQRDLKLLQRKLAAELVQRYPRRQVVYGFTEKRSIIDNAKRHLRCRYVLNVDLEDFFPSINYGRVHGLFLSLGAGWQAATILAQICCHDNALPQGAPTSPIVSNMICVKLDRELLDLAKRHGCVYTRYADDMTFSKKKGTFPPDLARLDEDDGRTILGSKLRAIIESNGFKPHSGKTWLFGRDFRQVVTGLVVNVKPNVRREWVRQLRAMIHAWRKYGLPAADAEYRSKYFRPLNAQHKPAPFVRVVLGKMEFLKMVKGIEDPVYRALQRELVIAKPEYISVMENENAMLLHRDVFISHASEDKDDLVKELADRLIAEGVSVWYDEYAIQLGDDLLEKIDEGLANSQFGVIVFSPNFFNKTKTWTKREYSALVAVEDTDKSKRILPIWHKITKEELTKRSPIIANRVALLSEKDSAAEMAKKIAARIRSAKAAPPRPPSPQE